LMILGSLLINLVAGPYYFRKLHRLIQALEEHDYCAFEALQKPSLEKLGYKMSPASSMALVNYVWKKSYAKTSSKEVVLAGSKAYRGLVVSFSAVGIMFLGFAMLMLASTNV